MLAAALPAELTPTDVVGQDIDDVRLLAKSLLQRCKLFINRFVFRRPRLLVFSLLISEGASGW